MGGGHPDIAKVPTYATVDLPDSPVPVGVRGVADDIASAMNQAIWVRHNVARESGARRTDPSPNKGHQRE